MTTRVSDLASVCEWASCESTDTAFVDDLLLCLEHRAEHRQLQQMDLQSEAVRAGLHTAAQCLANNGIAAAHRRQALELIERQHEELTQVLEGMLQRHRQELEQLRAAITNPPAAPPEKKLRLAREVLDAGVLGFTREDLVGRGKARDLSYARQWLMHQMRHELGLTLTEIGGLLDRDHSSVLHGIRAAERRLRESHLAVA